MKIKFLISIASLLCCNYGYACSDNALPLSGNTTYASTNTINILKNNINNQTFNITISPTYTEAAFVGCSASTAGTTSFEIKSGTSLDPLDTVVIGSKTYFRITSAQDPIANNRAAVYIAFSIKDNKDNATLYPISSASEVIFFNGSSASRGLRVEQISLLVKGTNLTPGTYNITPVNLGQLTARSTIGLVSYSPFKNLTLTNLSYTIAASTCTVNSPTFSLPNMRTSDFKTTNTAVGPINFTMTATCADDAQGTHYSATITDNYSTVANNNGILLNGISASSGGSNVKIKLTDSTNNPIPIGPFSLQNKFDFGLLTSSKTATKSLTASYIVETLPATVGSIKSIGVLNLIYD